MREQVSQRTIDFTSSAELAPADAVVYLLRNWHAVDNEFLLGFHDRVGLDVPPVSAVAVLSRADEVGGGDTDALEQAGRLARSLAEDPTLRSLVANVLPVAGLLAQSAVTLTEATYRSLAALASLERGRRRRRAAQRRPLRRARPPAVRARRRSASGCWSTLGLYGVRRAIEAIRAGRVTSAQTLSQELTRASGLDALHAVIFRSVRRRGHRWSRRRRCSTCSRAPLDSGQVRPDPDLLEQLERIRVNGHAIIELRALNEVLCSPSLAMGPTPARPTSPGRSGPRVSTPAPGSASRRRRRTPSWPTGCARRAVGGRRWPPAR